MTTTLPFNNLRDRVIVITGCAGQIGHALCQHFAKMGCRVVGMDIAQVGTKFENSFAQSQHQPINIQADITDQQSVEDALAEIKQKIGMPQGLIHAAAMDSSPDASSSQNGPLETLNIEDFKRVIDVNVTGSMIVAKVFGTAMAIEGKGSIALISSIYGEVSPRQDIYQYRRDQGDDFYKPVAYSVSKSALSNMVRYLATYWAHDGVRINSVILAGIFNNQDQAFLDGYLKNVPLGRMADVDDLFGAMTLLLSDESSYMTGSALTIDGGYTAW